MVGPPQISLQSTSFDLRENIVIHPWMDAINLKWAGELQRKAKSEITSPGLVISKLKNAVCRLVE